MKEVSDHRYLRLLLVAVSVMGAGLAAAERDWFGVFFWILFAATYVVIPMRGESDPSLRWRTPLGYALASALLVAALARLTLRLLYHR